MTIRTYATEANAKRRATVIAVAMADALAPTNPQFNRALFFRACGLEE